MLTAEVLLAAALLAGPTKGDPDPAVIAILRPQVMALAVADEILDTRELGYIMGLDPLGDLAMLHGRYRDFAAVPPLSDAERFPDRKVVAEMLALNRAYRSRLMDRLGVDLIHAGEIRATIESVDLRYQAWDSVRDSSCTYYYVTVRRQGLDCLRSLIGDEAFYAGRMPSPIP